MYLQTQQQYGIRNNGCQLVWRVPKDGLRRLQTNSFYYRVIKAWNELLSEVVNAHTVNAFKARLDSVRKNLPSKYIQTLIESGSYRWIPALNLYYMIIIYF